jgi:hypothetical protein
MGKGLVRAGSVPHRKLLVLCGHEWSGPVDRIRGSHDVTASTWAAELAWGRVRIPPIAAEGRRPLLTRRASPELASPCGRVGADAPRPHERRPHRSCHYRAIHGSLDRSPTDTHGQSDGCRDLLSSSSDQVAILPDLALQAGGRRFNPTTEHTVAGQEAGGHQLPRAAAACTSRALNSRCGTRRLEQGASRWPERAETSKSS